MAPGHGQRVDVAFGVGVGEAEAGLGAQEPPKPPEPPVPASVRQHGGAGAAVDDVLQALVQQREVRAVAQTPGAAWRGCLGGQRWALGGDGSPGGDGAAPCRQAGVLGVGG